MIVASTYVARNGIAPGMLPIVGTVPAGLC